MAITLAELTIDAFQGCEGRIYKFQNREGEAGAVELELLAVAPHTPSGIPGTRAVPFSLLFRSVDNAVLRPGLPRLIHPDFEPFELFIPRIEPPDGRPRNAVYYEAIFS